MPSIDLDNQVAGRRRTLQGGGGYPILCRQQTPHFICYPLDLRMVIHAAGVPIQLPEVAFSLAVAIQGPLFTV